jgi:hypothetical protein
VRGNGIRPLLEQHRRILISQPAQLALHQRIPRRIE